MGAVSCQPLALSCGPAQVVEAYALRLGRRRRWRRGRRLGLRRFRRQRIGGLPSGHRARRIAVKVNAQPSISLARYSGQAV